MKLSGLVAEGAVVHGLKASDREGAIAELLDAIIASGAVEAALREELLARILEREERGSTGFGRGVAVPHVKHENLPQILAAVGVSADGVDFNALDKQPVHSIFLLLSPAESPEQHLQAMETIFKNLSQEKFRRFLRQAEGVEDIRCLLQEADDQSLEG